MNADIDIGAIGLLALYSLDVNDKLLTVHLNDLAYLISLIMTAYNLNFIVLANGH